MPKYKVPVRRVSYGYITVDADNPQLAIDEIINLDDETAEKSFKEDGERIVDYADSTLSIEDVIEIIEQ